MKLNQTNQSGERTSTQVFALIAALAISMMLASGCSTPVVSGNSVDTKTSDAFVNCVLVLTPQGRQYQCYSVTTAGTTPATTSYTRYTYSKTGLTSKVSETEMQASYEAYLSTLSADQKEDLSAQWTDLASSAK